MIITDLSYQEITAEAHDLEGGLDLSFNTTYFNQHTSLMQTASTSGPGGSTSMTSGGSLQINTAGLGAIVLGA
ncbi:CTB family bacteriocin [Leptolyngbya sp. AN03gr2]|uniref:CTB family bacteriocin n=1 Tax=unclassified Leptolyngbya TaxID=2650499 RepID=UPI003D312D67